MMAAVAARVRDALQTTMMHMDSAGFQDLRERYGFTVVEVNHNVTALWNQHTSGSVRLKGLTNWWQFHMHAAAGAYGA